MKDFFGFCSFLNNKTKKYTEVLLKETFFLLNWIEQKEEKKYTLKRKIEKKDVCLLIKLNLKK